MVPVLTAIRTASPLMKWGVISGLVLAFVGWIYLKGVWAERERVHEAHIQELLELAQHERHAKKALQVAMQQAAERARTVKEQAAPIHKETIRYVKSTKEPCVLPPGFVAQFDALSRLPQLSETSMSHANEDASRVDDDGAVDPPAVELVPEESITVTTDEALQAYDLAVEKLLDERLLRQRMVTFDNARYQSEMKWIEKE